MTTEVTPAASRALPSSRAAPSLTHAAVVLLCLSFGGCATVNIPGIPHPVSRKELCETPDCGAQGQYPVSLVSNDRSVRSIQKVTEVLGKELDPDNPLDWVQNDCANGGAELLFTEGEDYYVNFPTERAIGAQVTESNQLQVLLQAAINNAIPAFDRSGWRR